MKGEKRYKVKVKIKVIGFFGTHTTFVRANGFGDAQEKAQTQLADRLLVERKAVKVFRIEIVNG